MKKITDVTMIDNSYRDVGLNFGCGCRSCKTVWQTSCAWDEHDRIQAILDASGWTRDRRGFNYCPDCAQALLEP